MGNDHDAVAVLTYPNTNVYLAVYIQAGDSFTITGIQDGVYNLYFTLGRNWDESLGRFIKEKSFFRFERSLQFKTIWTYNGYQYTRYELTLHPVREGNVVIDTVSERDFPVL